MSKKKNANQNGWRKSQEVAGESDAAAALHADRRSKAACRPTTMPLSQRLTTRGSAFPIIIVPAERRAGRGY